MNENKGLIFWKWAVILLILCNVGLIATIFLRPGFPHGQRPESPHDFVVRSLKLSDEQVKKYDVMVAAHHKSMEALRMESRKYREALFDDLKNGRSARSLPDSLAQLIANDQKQIELITYNHFADVRELCTDAQKKDFDNIIRDVMTKMNGNNRGGPPPAGRPGPPPGAPPGPDGREGGGPPPEHPPVGR